MVMAESAKKPKPKRKPSGPFLAGFLRWLTRVSTAQPKLTLWLVLVTACACAGYTVTFLKFRSSRSDLISSDEPAYERWQAYANSFGDSSDIVVVAVLPAAIGKIKGTADLEIPRRSR